MPREFPTIMDLEPDQNIRYDNFIDRRSQSPYTEDKQVLRQGIAVSLGTSSISRGVRQGAVETRLEK